LHWNIVAVGLSATAEDRIVLHSSISDFGQIEQFKRTEFGSMAPIAHSQQSSNVNVNRKKLSRALDPFFNGKKESIRTKFKHALDGSASRIGGSRLLGDAQSSRNVGSKNLGSKMSFSKRSTVQRPSTNALNVGDAVAMGGNRGGRMTSRIMDPIENDEVDFKIMVNGENLGSGIKINVGEDGSDNVPDSFFVSIVPPTPMTMTKPSELRNRRLSTNDEFPLAPNAAPTKSSNTLQEKSIRSLDLNNEFSQAFKVSMPGIYQDAVKEINEVEKKLPNFHAMPEWVRRRVSPKKVAIAMVFLVAVIVVYVFTINIQKVMAGGQ